MNGVSITCIEDAQLITSVVEFVYNQQRLYKQDKDSIFRNIKSTQDSYPRRGFCSAAVKQLKEYFKYDAKEKQADLLLSHLKKGTTGAAISKKLINMFAVDKEGKDKIVESRTRIGQAYFRRMVLANFNNKCWITGLDVPKILRASHIVAWAEDKRYRMDPENGLCLSATYDAALDKHLISFDEEYRMIVSKEIKDHYTNEAAKEYFQNFEGKKMIMPKLYIPSQKLLAKHRELLVV